jgi:hypothetical protein
LDTAKFLSSGEKGILDSAGDLTAHDIENTNENQIKFENMILGASYLKTALCGLIVSNEALGR